MKTSAQATVIIASLLAFIPTASAGEVTELWKGDGVLFDRSNKPIGKYRLEMYRTNVNKKKMLNEVKVFLPNAKTKTISCEITKSKKGWSTDCRSRKGGGYCFGEGLCIDYMADQKGSAFATTIVMDGKDTMRMLRTELKRGKAVRFFRERLTRVVPPTSD